MSLREADLPAEPECRKHSVAVLVLGAVGVVYGDIGTSPLYAFRESIHHVGKDGLLEAEVLGIISMLIWSLILVVTVKYVLFMMRADNNGEGGTLSLLALVRHVAGKWSPFTMLCGMFGAALFYGDSMLTPAISVLSAVEGLKLVTPVFTPYVMPIAIAILIGLFAVQRYGTGSVARWFGPITLIWFITMATMAVPHIIKNPTVFGAFSPLYAAQFLIEHQTIALAVLGSVFLAVTGAEALYADMGHFGRGPIRKAWFWIVFPCLTINYMGQAALVLNSPETVKDPFFLMAPQWGLLPLVLLATIATIVASQAVISGAFSLTRQAVQLGLLPRLDIRHTSASELGQIYIPRINLMLLVGVIFLVVEFKTSSEMAAAYGIAVSATMFIDTILAVFLIRMVWKKSALFTFAILLPFFAIEGIFVAANLTKIMQGGYVPLLIALSIVAIMICWKQGSRKLQAKEAKMTIPLEDFALSVAKKDLPKVQGTAIFLTQDSTLTPTSLLHNLKHNKMLHEQNVILSVITETTPRIDPLYRTEIGAINDHFIVVRMHFGYMETPNIAQAMHYCKKIGIKFDIMTTSFFVSRRVVKTSSKDLLGYWKDRLFIFLSRNAARPSDFYHIPTDRVVEIGSQVTI